VAIRKVAVHLYLTLIIKELKFSVEHDRVVTTLNIIFSVVFETSGQTFMKGGQIHNSCSLNIIAMKCYM
jgi:hypothetical protein